MSDHSTVTEPRYAFEESRRLTGANRDSASAAVILTPLGPAAADGAAHGRWIAQVVSICAALQWPPPLPRVRAHQAGVFLAFASPADCLFTATEVNEWAWERAAADHPEHAVAGFDLAQPAADHAVAHFARRAALERSSPRARLAAAAEEHGLLFLEDDDTISLGEGQGSVSFPRAALSLPMDVPWSRLFAIPKLLVTGSNGKTTTSRLLAAMASAAGLTPGLCSTEGVVVAGRTVAFGDYAGPAGARAVLRHAEVTAAVLETARGGILRRGLAVPRADVAVVTNVSADHLGEHGVDSVEDIAEVKLVLAHAVQAWGTLVLNGADHTLLRAAASLPHSQAARWALFAPDHDTAILQVVRQQGGSTCGVRAGRLILILQGAETDLGAVVDMPLSLGGAAAFNVENLAAAALAAAVLGWPLAGIRQVLRNFGNQSQDNPGRLQRFDHRGATVLLDYAHNPAGLAQLLTVARSLLAPASPVQAAARLGLLLGQAGNRDDLAIAELARTAAQTPPDRVLIKELPLMLRGRAAGSVSSLIEQTLLSAGLPPESLARVEDEATAALQLLDWAQPGDVVVLPLHTSAVRDRLLKFLHQGDVAPQAS